MQEFTRWHDWNVTEYLGRGAYGKVYKIERSAYGHTYKSALKVIRIPEDAQAFDDVVSTGMSEEDAREYFHDMAKSVASECALMSELSGNSNIVSFEDFEAVPEDDGYSVTIYIRMELLEPLVHYMKEHGMTRTDVLDLAGDILSALELCEKKNIIHRDIKAENIFRSGQGTFKLGDFGIARELDRNGAGMSKKGTISYMAPEVYRGMDYGANVDIYSLGILLYRLMNNNRLPFLPPYPERITYADTEKANLTRMTGEEELPLPCNAQDEFGRIILRACSFDPAERYQTAGEMKKDIGIYAARNKALIPEDDAFEDEDKTVRYPKSGDTQAETDTVSAGKEPAAGAAAMVSTEPASGEIKADDGRSAAVKEVPAGEMNRTDGEKNPDWKKGAGKYIGIAAAAAVLILVLIVVSGAFKGGKVNIGGIDYNKDTKSVMFSNEEVSIEDIQKLDQLPDLEEVDIKDCDLSNEQIEAIGNIKTGVTKLIIHNCHGFDDISPLANLPYLGILNLSSCDITDSMLEAADLGSMEHLQGLRLHNNPGVTSLDPIRDAIPKLRGLSVTKTGVTDVSALSKAGELELLLAADCGISDISAVRCKKMKYLNLERNNISDISVMKGMPELEYVSLSDNNVSDLAPLAGNENLDTVKCNGNKVRDLTPLSRCPNLTALQVCGNGLETLEGLSGHETLIELYANDNNLTSMKGLEHELLLCCLAVARNDLTDLEGAENCTKLIRVNFEGNNIEDFSSLTKSNDTMQWVILNDNPVKSLDVLKNMPALQGVYCDNTGITTLDPLSDKADLMAVSAQNNELTSIEALANKNNLQTADVSGNRISDISPLMDVLHDDFADLVLDFRNNEIRTLKFPDCDTYAMNPYIAVTGNPVSETVLTSKQESEGLTCNYLAMNYYDGLEGETWTEKISAQTVPYIVGCPLDKQVELQSHLKAGTLDDNIQFAEKDDSGAVMDPLLYEKKCFDSTVAVDTKYGDNAVITDEDEEEEFNEIERYSGE